MKIGIVYEKFYGNEKFVCLKFGANLVLPYSELDAFYTNEKIGTMLAGMKPSILYENSMESIKIFA